MLKIQSVSLASSGIDRVRELSLSCRPGSITAILGPNGAGKTSLLKILSGELSANQGKVLLNERQINEWKPIERAKMLACLPQHSTLNFPFTASEVVTMGRMPHDTGTKIDQEITEQVLDIVDCRHLAKRIYTELSGGEKQRVQLARVLCQVWRPVKIDDKLKTRVLLLDEPASSLDVAHQQLFQKIAHNMTADGVLVVMVVHDLNIAFQCAHQLVLMSNGRLVANGTPDELSKPELLQSVFGVNLQFIKHPTTQKPVIILN